MNNNMFRWRYSILTSPYKPEFYWWELVVMLKKAIIVMIIDLTNGFSESFRAYLAIVFISAIGSVEAILRPYLYDNLSQM